MTLEEATRIGAAAHAGQGDKGGAPYVLHPPRLILRCHSHEERLAAVLHGLVEDSQWTVDRLAREGLSDPVTEALGALTKRPGEEYADFIERVCSCELAIRVSGAFSLPGSASTQLESVQAQVTRPFRVDSP